MYPFISVLVVIVSILLILIVLVQNSKGGGLASNFSSSNQMMGVRKTADFLEKATWTLAGIIAILSISSAAFIHTSDEVVGKQSAMKDEVVNAVQVDPNLNTPDFNKEAASSQEAPAATQEAPAPTKEAPAAK